MKEYTFNITVTNDPRLCISMKDYKRIFGYPTVVIPVYGGKYKSKNCE